MKRLASILAAIALLAMTTAACGSNGKTSVRATNSQTWNVGDADNGHTLRVHFGDTLIVTLDSTYWTIAPSDGLILDPQGLVQTSIPPSCTHSVPGSGCGDVIATYDIGHVGTSTLKAHRTTCGEALRCLGKQREWSLTVVAS